MALSLLVLTDFTQPADHALAYADRLAVVIGVRLVRLHVRRDAILDPEQLSGTLTDLDTEAINRAFARLERGLTAPAVAEIGRGLVAEAVARAVRQHQPTLIVLGRTEAGTTPDELLNPLAVALLRTIPHPLLLVPASPTTLCPRRVLLAVDGEPFTLGSYTGGGAPARCPARRPHGVARVAARQRGRAPRSGPQISGAHRAGRRFGRTHPPPERVRAAPGRGHLAGSRVGRI